MKPSPLQVVVDALERLDRKVKRTGDQVDAQCPAHDDHEPSLSVRYDRTSGKVLLRCHVGCNPAEIVTALGLTWADLFDPKVDGDRTRRREIVATYDYATEDGTVVFQKVRYGPVKGFKVRRPDGRGGWIWGIGEAPRVLYRLDEVIAARDAGRPILLVEGEKDADRAAALGLTATTTFTGAAKEGDTPKWRSEYTESLRGGSVLIVADNDAPGLAHAQAAAAALQGSAATVRVVRPALDFPKSDLTDHLDAGYGIEDLVPVSAGMATDEVLPVEEEMPARGVLVELSTVEPERLTWMWQDRIPNGKIIVIEGDPSVGKSTLAVDLGAHVSTGKPWPDGASCERGGVLILSAEDGLADTIRPRLDAAGGDATRVHALTAVRTVDDDGRPGERPPTLADISVITEAILQINARLVIVDVLMAFLGGKVDSHKDQDIRVVLSRLTKVGEQTGCVFVLLRHLNKAAGGSPMYRGGGSIGIVGAARAAYLIARDPDDPETRVMACVKSNLAREPESLTYRLESAPGTDVARVVWTGASDLDAAGLLRVDHEETDDRSEIEEWLTDLFDANPDGVEAKSAMKEVRAAGFSLDQAKRAKKRLGIKSVKESMGSGWNWVRSSEGGTKGAKGAALREPPPSTPSALPSGSATDLWLVSGAALPTASNDRTTRKDTA